MVSKIKNDDMDFFYLDSNKKKKASQNKKEVAKKTTSKKEVTPKKQVARKKTIQKKLPKKVAEKNDEVFNIDNEIVIGITPKKTVGQANKKGKNNQKSGKQSIIAKHKAKIIKYAIITVLILVAIVLFFLSPVFNVKVINVNNNSKISSEEIISLSGILKEENTFKINKSKSIKSIKENPYIESITITRQLPDTVNIDVVEREATYMIEFANAFVYINNQGYMLETSEEKKELPILIDILTPTETIAEGNRLIKEDLIKLEDVIKIVNSAKSTEIGVVISRISLKEFSLIFESEGKTAYIGDTTNINTKMLYLKDILQKEKR